MTSTDTLHVGNGAGFSGDRVDAPGPVVDTLVATGRPAAPFLEVLGERTIALARLERRRDPSRGYEPMLERLLDPLLARMALRHGLPDRRVAVVDGDDVPGSIDLAALDVHEADASVAGISPDALLAANAYPGAAPLVEALAQGAETRVLDLFRHRGAVQVVRYDLPPLHAFFVADDVLEGGVNTARNLDGCGKSHWSCGAHRREHRREPSGGSRTRVAVGSGSLVIPAVPPVA